MVRGRPSKGFGYPGPDPVNIERRGKDNPGPGPAQPFDRPNQDSLDNDTLE